MSAWWVRRLHNGPNRWTQRRIAGLDGRMGWSAASWDARLRGSRTGRWLSAEIDGLFWPGHCREEWERVRAGLPFDETDPRLPEAVSRTVRRLARVLVAALALLALAGFGLWRILGLLAA